MHQNSDLNDSDDFIEQPLVLSQKLEKQREKVEKRKYTLEELEIEGFAESTSSSKQNSDFEEEEVDLNSLIEGDVDEIDEELGKNLDIYTQQYVEIILNNRGKYFLTCPSI